MKTTRRPLITPHIRWMVRRDMPEVLAIEEAAFIDDPWTEADFISELRQRNSIGMAAERSERVVGYMVYELFRDHLWLKNIAVPPALWSRGIGMQMIGKLKSKLSFERRTHIIADVKETNLDAALFFKAMGFSARVMKPEDDERSGADCDFWRFVYVHSQ